MAKMASELKTAGFTDLRECGGTPVKWVTASMPNGARVAILKQARGIWHLFHLNGATVSGHTPESLISGSGGLGDVVETDAQVRAYERLLRSALPHISANFPLGIS